MQVETTIGTEEVTVFVDGDVVGTLDRAWWDDWTDSIDNTPEECLTSCLSSADDDLQRAITR